MPCGSAKDGRTRADATDPPPRVCEVARTGSSPGSGPSRSAFPTGGQWLVRADVCELPVTVAGPRRSLTGFRVPRSPSIVRGTYPSPSRLASAAESRPLSCMRAT
jgi:hypothetical protein